MKWPDLVPDRVCVSSIKISLTDGVGEDGAPKETVLYEGKCSYKEKTKRVLDAQRQQITILATALFNGDIAPDSPIVEGYATVDGNRKYMIYQSQKARNPDGTINYTQLELM